LNFFLIETEAKLFASISIDFFEKSNLVTLLDKQELILWQQS